MTENEMLDAMRDLLTPVNIKLENMQQEIADVKHEIADVRHEIADVRHEIADVKHEVADLKLNIASLDKRMSNLEFETKKGFRKNNDEIQTLVAILRARNIMPIAQ